MEPLPQTLANESEASSTPNLVLVDLNDESSWPDGCVDLRPERLPDRVAHYQLDKVNPRATA